MFSFDFERATVLGSITKSPNGFWEIVRASPAFDEKSKKLVSTPAIRIHPRNIRFRRTPQLNDSSVVVVDFGPKGLKTKQVVIGGCSGYKMNNFFQWCSSGGLTFPGFHRTKA